MLVRWMIRRALRDVPVWVQVVGIAALLSYTGWHNFIRMPTGGSLVGHNHIERPIYSYWVNDNWGGNGGVTCCWSFDGNTANIVWILSMSQAQQAQGMEEERHSVTLPMPERTRNDLYLHVHFLPDNQVKLAWSPDFSSPYEKH